MSGLIATWANGETNPETPRLIIRYLQSIEMKFPNSWQTALATISTIPLVSLDNEIVGYTAQKSLNISDGSLENLENQLNELISSTENLPNSIDAYTAFLEKVTLESWNNQSFDKHLQHAIDTIMAQSNNMNLLKLVLPEISSILSKYKYSGTSSLIDNIFSINIGVAQIYEANHLAFSDKWMKKGAEYGEYNADQIVSISSTFIMQNHEEKCIDTIFQSIVKLYEVNSQLLTDQTLVQFSQTFEVVWSYFPDTIIECVSALQALLVPEIVARILSGVANDDHQHTDLVIGNLLDSIISHYTDKEITEVTKLILTAGAVNYQDDADYALKKWIGALGDKGTSQGIIQLNQNNLNDHQKTRLMAKLPMTFWLNCPDELFHTLATDQNNPASRRYLLSIAERIGEAAVTYPGKTIISDRFIQLLPSLSPEEIDEMAPIISTLNAQTRLEKETGILSQLYFEQMEVLSKRLPSSKVFRSLLKKMRDEEEDRTSTS